MAVVLKVSMHCNACRKKVFKLLQKIEGVAEVHIDAESGKVTVSGNVDPTILLKKLKKAGKRAELCGSEGGSNKYPCDQPEELQVEDGKGEQEDNGKPRKVGGGGGGLKNFKLPELKGLKCPFRKNKKSVKFDLPPDNNADGERDENDVDEERAQNDVDEESDGNNADEERDEDEEKDEEEGADNIDDNSEGSLSKGCDGENGGYNNVGAQSNPCPYMLRHGFQCIHLGRTENQQRPPPVRHTGNIPTGEVPPGYLHGGMVSPEMVAPPANPYQQQYMVAMMEPQRRMMMNGQGGGGANPPMPYGYGMMNGQGGGGANPPTPYGCGMINGQGSCGANPPMPYGYETSGYYASSPPRYVDPYTNISSDENPNACSIM